MIESIDEEVFSRYYEFVYSRDYSALYPVPQSSGNEANRWDSSSLNWNLFHLKGLLLNYNILLAELGHTPRLGSEKDLSNNPFTSYTVVFLSHAEIHQRTGDIVRLLVFVFKDSEYMRNLEVMLRDYMVWNMEILMRNADFKSFLARNLSLEETVFR
ncbi:hypothetical protein N7471_002315 [Penicillium samsonianum]|uniref:uncharacterized protein n=1 Tax=Penicillium samsonianum TaxID=1882272 RepID=UPI0025490F5F|nr:uncharacterized protein N7471_002315 [Penicillium samsonianum]KAJ6142862.1 hypothetical protein N7471_002315 [Penicillium samsonianum]